MEKHLNCAYLRRYIYNTLEAGGLKHYVSLNPDVRNSPRNRSAERNCIWPQHANRFPSGGAVVLSFAFAKQLNLFPIAFLNGETEMLWYCGLIKCFLFWSSIILPVLDQLCREHMEVWLLTFNIIARNTENVLLSIPSLLLILGTNWKLPEGV